MLAIVDCWKAEAFPRRRHILILAFVFGLAGTSLLAQPKDQKQKPPTGEQREKLLGELNLLWKQALSLDQVRIHHRLASWASRFLPSVTRP